MWKNDESNGKKVLVIEKKDQSIFISSFLNGYESLFVEDAKGALDAIKEKNFDAIIIGYNAEISASDVRDIYQIAQRSSKEEIRFVLLKTDIKPFAKIGATEFFRLHSVGRPGYAACAHAISRCLAYV